MSQTTVPYINYGDNIFFDVSPVCLLVSELSGDIDGPSRGTAALLSGTAGAVGPVQLAQLFCVSDSDWLSSLEPLILQLAPKSSPSNAPNENTYVYSIPQMHLPGLFW